MYEIIATFNFEQRNDSSYILPIICSKEKELRQRFSDIWAKASKICCYSGVMTIMDDNIWACIRSSIQIWLS